MTEEIMTDRERTALQLQRVTRLLEKAWPLIEEEAARREWASQRDTVFTNGNMKFGPYYTEMRELADEIAAEIRLTTEGER